MDKLKLWGWKRNEKGSDDVQEFTISVKMQRRWVPHFIGMLKSMERYGDLGASRHITIYSDGDGDFRPKFEFAGSDIPEEADPYKNIGGDLVYDAG